MVLPAPAADLGSARAGAWLDKLIQPLELSRAGILVCLRDATPTQLGPVVRALSGAPPWSEDGDVLQVCLRAVDVLKVARGSRVLLRVRLEDLDWLNIARPLFADRELRTILWADAAAFDGMLRRAVDFFDWVSRVVAVPSKAVPDFAVDGMRAALAAGAEVEWEGEGLRETLAAAGAGPVIDLHVEEPYLQLLASLRSEGVPIVAGVRGTRDVWRVRLAMAEVGRSESWIAVEPGESLPGFRRVHARQLDWDEASATLQAAGWSRPALTAAWLDLEPGRVEDAVKRADAAPAPGTVVGDQDAERNEVARAIAAEVAMTNELLESLVGDGAIEDAKTLLQEWTRRAKTLGAPLPASVADWLRRLDAEPRAAAPSKAAPVPDDWTLLERWTAGDRAAGSAIVERYFLQVRRYVYARVSANDHEDMVHEIFVRLIGHFERGHRVSSFRAYLFSVARAVLLEWLHRRYSVSGSIEFDEEDMNTDAGSRFLDDEIEKRDEQRWLIEALSCIPLDDRDILELRYFEALSSNELAAVFDVPASAIQLRLRQALSRLKQAFLEAQDEPQSEIDLEAQLKAARAQRGRP